MSIHRCRKYQLEASASIAETGVSSVRTNCTASTVWRHVTLTFTTVHIVFFWLLPREDGEYICWSLQQRQTCGSWRLIQFLLPWLAWDFKVYKKRVTLSCYQHGIQTSVDKQHQWPQQDRICKVSWSQGKRYGIASLHEIFLLGNYESWN